MPPDSAPRYDPHSNNAMFARILAEMDADRRDRQSFREEVRGRFDRGTERMDAQDALMLEIRAETKKTNGRVTRLEQGRRLLWAKITGGAAVVGALVWLLEKGIVSAPFWNASAAP